MAVRFVLAAATATLVCSFASTGLADSYVLEDPGRHPNYDIDIEGHGVLGTFGGPNPDDGVGWGFGLRGTYELVDNGFIETINNTFGISAGIDYLHWGSARVTTNCVPAVGGTLNCELRRRTFEEVIVPVTAQWNFWITRDFWSVFGEPGIAMRFRTNADNNFEPLVFFAGGRLHFADDFTLTLRVGYPYISLGATWIY